LGAINDGDNNLRFVEQIERQADVLNNLIQDLLELARVESGKTVFEISDIGLNAAGLQSVQEFEASAAKKEISLTIERADEDLVVRADAKGIRTIINNLISNAVHYTGAKGQVTVRILPDGDHALIEVEDTGIGIAPEHQARVFERFYRVDKARSRDIGGTGLGLSIVKHLTQSFGGSLELKSQIGKGSTFQVRLPRVLD
jgi:two-component system phosphate regulon sensor histidine kinase PhoR